MIVNSYPYNPSQQQQQRCIGLGQNQNQNSNHTQEASMNRLLNLSSASQQNSLYESSFDQHQNQQQQTTMAPISSHDLASLHFDSSPMNPIELALSGQAQDNNHQPRNNNNNNNNNNKPHRATINQTNNDSQATNSAANNNNNNNDMSLYSPSSSTSLLYHIYDQINLPNEQQHQYQATADNNNKQLVSSAAAAATATTLGQPKKNNTTILNPANLFNQQQPAPTLPQLPLQMQMQMHQQQQHHHHQQQLSQLAEMQKQQQFYSTNYQQHPFNTINHHHHHQASYMTTGGQQTNLMLQQQQQQHRLQRPLSSSGGSSTMSGQSIPAYGRHPRQSFINSSTAANFATTATTKSQHNLASVLHANNTLGLGGLQHPHLIFGSVAGGHSPRNLSPQQANGRKLAPTGCCWPFSSGRRFDCKHLNQRARHLLYEYRTVVKCSILLIVLAFSLMSMIKFTLLSASTTSTTARQANNQAARPPIINQHEAQFSVGPSSSILASNNFYPPYQKPDPTLGIFTANPTGQALLNSQPPATADDEQFINQAGSKQDMLKSRLLTGEFVIISQNFSRTLSQQTILAERIVRLMDQVFLSSPDVKQLYSRMEVISIRPNQPAGGIVVSCNIILNESIAYAAQQFGLALYNSLSNSNGLLAGHSDYLIDKNSIKLNSVPDKDLKSGIVPAAFIPPSLSHEFPSIATRAPSAGGGGQPIDNQMPAGESHGNGPASFQANLELMNQVVWSEWSDWSSCVDKNGVCDPLRLHSRLRRCVAQHTGEKVDVIQCKQRYSMQDLELEVSDCQRSCSQSSPAGQQQQQQQQQQSLDAQHPIMSDAPSALGPHTASPFFVDSQAYGAAAAAAAAIISPSPIKPDSHRPDLGGGGGSGGSGLDSAEQAAAMQTTSAASVVSAASNSQQQQLQPTSSPPEADPKQGQPASTVLIDIMNGSSAMSAPTMMPPMVSLAANSHPEISCSNCTGGEICLLLIQQKVPFCAKVKDPADNCGGWCKGQNQLCQQVGSSAFKCIHDSECLPEEWRCHDSQCIPLSNHCDGHSNCYDNSDERDCPAIIKSP